MKDSLKNTALALLLMAVTATAVGAPASAYARGGDDDDRYEYRYDDDRDDDDDDDEDDDDDDDDRRRGDDDDDDDRDDELEIEADVFTDTTIVKVEREGSRKVIFETDADTREEVVDVVVDRFGLDEAAVEAALEFEIEDRASRAKDRAKLTNQPNRPVSVCKDNNDELEIEADVFTDTTIVKVERVNGRVTVFETDATTTDEIVEVIADRFTSLSEAEIEAALDREVEDRASRPSDFRVTASDDCDKRDGRDPKPRTDDERIAELRVKVAELQTLLERLIALLRNN